MNYKCVFGVFLNMRYCYHWWWRPVGPCVHIIMKNDMVPEPPLHHQVPPLYRCGWMECARKICHRSKHPPLYMRLFKQTVNHSSYLLVVFFFLFQCDRNRMEAENAKCFHGSCCWIFNKRKMTDTLLLQPCYRLISLHIYSSRWIISRWALQDNWAGLNPSIIPCGIKFLSQNVY